MIKFIGPEIHGGKKSKITAASEVADAQRRVGPDGDVIVCEPGFESLEVACRKKIAHVFVWVKTEVF